VRQTFDQNKDGQVSDEEAKFFLDGKDEVDFNQFVETCKLAASQESYNSSCCC